ncbi:MAG TPA: beta-ketoacyl-[acyl-carrier-protein] synthase family protein [Tepidisphaeraceae bacterium]|nr:beta-ketoacyl-[acyl-carrier-protein] synthase family protein [Tepidisphaeraceae bacterium]
MDRGRGKADAQAADEVAKMLNDGIVITGAGLVTPLGLSRETTWRAVVAGACGLREMSAIEQPLPRGSVGGQAPDAARDGEAGNQGAVAEPREIRYLRRAIDESLCHAGLESGRPYRADRIGVMLGTTLHGMRAAGRFFRTGDLRNFGDFLAGATIRAATAHLNFTGFSATACSACSSSLGSVALGISLLRDGQLDLVVAGGYDTISEYAYGGFNSLRLVSPDTLRPFTRHRQGMKLAEGYGIVVLERAHDADARKVRPLATVAGYGETADAHHLTQPHPQGEGAARAMSAALASAALTPHEIDMIAAHATGTPDNDAGEYAALSRVFGDDLPRVPVVAFKSHLGHTLGGAGAVELILSALALRDQIVPACVNVRAEDLEFPGLHVAVGSSRPAVIRNTLNTSLGFGGANTCVVLSRDETSPAQSPFAGEGERVPLREGQQVEDISHSTVLHDDTDDLPSRRDILRLRAAHPHSESESRPEDHSSVHAQSKSPATRKRQVFITGVGVVLPGMIGNDAFAAAMNGAEPRQALTDTGPIPEADLSDLLNARRVRRMSDYVKLSLAAAMRACRDAGIADIPAFSATCAALLGTTHGSPNFSQAYYGQIVREGIAGANPVLFAEGVPNAAAAHLSLALSLKGPCQTVIGTRTAGLDALHLAATRIARGEWDRAIVGAAEEYCPLVNAAYGQWGLYAGPEPSIPLSATGGFVVGCGAVTLVLESARSIQSRGIAPRGKILNSTGPTPMPGFALRHPDKLTALLSDVQCVIDSANGTWIDRVESLALRHRQDLAISTLRGRLAETFSVMPLAAIAAPLLTGRVPSCPGVAASAARLQRFAVLATDYTRALSAASVALESTR